MSKFSPPPPPPQAGIFDEPRHDARSSDRQEDDWDVCFGTELPAVAHSVDEGEAMPRGDETAPEGEQTDGAVLTEPLSGHAKYLLFTTMNDLVCAYAGGNPLAIAGAPLRGGLAGVCFLTGILAGNRRGVCSSLMSLSSLGLVLAQAGSLMPLVSEALREPDMLGPIVAKFASVVATGQMPAFPSSLLEQIMLFDGTWTNILTQSLSCWAAVRALFAGRK